MNITVVKHNPNWKDEYLKEKKLIEEILQKELVNSFHIGSTSIPNLKAKPIIDILLVVNDIKALDDYSQQFEKLGYEVMGEFGIKQRRYYRKGGNNRTHQIHAFQYDNTQEIERHLSFRDYLCQNPEIRKQYGELKSTLAHKFPHDITGYSNGKDEFVKKIEKEALRWHWFNR
ncbi:GrpB family protein [Priestia filamentosa]|uniref:GrpB family protein n=1 Tax=Priestia filamentosa TaxID=1402861 RepID=UPI001FB552EA|nr:GrpB family protein [Priestia filamentosa]MED3729335.1 GrpB family protein [Priestia filamentosa]UOE58917.1 GrpB family protein [Priestia filamentosa]